MGIGGVGGTARAHPRTPLHRGSGALFLTRRGSRSQQGLRRVIGLHVEHPPQPTRLAHALRKSDAALDAPGKLGPHLLAGIPQVAQDF